MDNNKIETISNLFEDKEIRSVWDSEKEEYFFSVVDVINALTDSPEPRKYWSVLKSRLKKEGSEVTTNCSQLKMLAPDGKMRLRDAMTTRDIFRLIESIPSSKAEPFKVWLANLGSERIDEVFDPEIAVNRAIDYYRNRGYSDEWISKRLNGILNRKKLTDTWKENGISKNYEYAMLTNEIYKSWSGMKASEYKELKGLRKESLRDNMTDIEIALTDIGYFPFSAFGYTDSTGETPVSDEIIARYNRAQELSRNSVICRAYSLSSTGLKLVSDSGHYSKETKLSDFFSSFASHSFNLVANGSTAFTFSYKMQYAWPERYCALTASNDLWGYYVTSASESALSVSKVGARASSSSDYTFTEQASTISLSKSETSSYAVYTASLNGAVIGTITIPYATADNIPSFGTAGEYTLVQ